MDDYEVISDKLGEHLIELGLIGFDSEVCHSSH